MADTNVVLLNSKDQIDGIKDDQFYYTQDELAQIRNSLGMYISKDQTDGAIHLFKEIFANSIDECNNQNDHWKNTRKEITVIYYESERKIIVIDNGRGIPMDILVSVVMKKHASTKTIGISQSRNKKMTGLNGVGLTVCAALTDYMYITSHRGSSQKTIELFDGVLKEHPVEKSAQFQTGTETGFIPSEKYLGPINLTTDLIEDYIRNMSYILEPDISLTFIGEKNPDEVKKKKKLFTHEYKAQGLGACVKYMSSSLEFNPIEVKYVTDNYDISMAFSYDRTLDDSSISSFANYVITTEGGVHEVIATRAICDFFNKEAKRQEPNSKYEVSFDDCKRGLVLAVNLEIVNPKFEGQHKTRISNNEIIADAKKGLYNVLFKIMNNNQLLLKKIISYLRQIAKARAESHKIKGVAAVKKTTTFLEDSMIDKYFTVANRNSTGYKEIFLCEGDSAAGGILNCRNPLFQAVYTVQGVTDNVHDLTLSQLLQKKTFSELITILGTGVGKDFDIAKLRYNKIIICTDSDIDGNNITSLLLCFFYIFMPQIITEGKLYKAMPPLYLMDLKSLRRYYNGREWLYDKNEYYKMINTIIANNCEIALEIPLEEGSKRKSKQPAVVALDKKKALEWLTMNSEYRLELENLGKKAACEPLILEIVCYLKLTTTSPFEFKKEISKAFPEMNYDENSYSLIGSYNGNFFSLICDSLFDKSAQRFIKEMKKNPTLYVWYRNSKDPKDKMKRATIGQFLEDVDKTFNVKINQRYKGLGEADADLLFRTTTNPKYRKLLKITLKDVEKTTNVFELLHGKSTKLREARRELLDNAHLSYADIDN